MYNNSYDIVDGFRILQDANKAITNYKIKIYQLYKTTLYHTIRYMYFFKMFYPTEGLEQ